VTFAPLDDAIEDVRRGRMVVVCDGEDRENEGDLVMAAQFATPEAVHFMATEGRGLICLALPPERCDELGLHPVSARNEAPLQTAFTPTIQAAEGMSSGISAPDRARTIQVAIDPSSEAGDLASPGHIFPLRARAGGVLERTGHTEASVDLTRLAGLIPGGVICEIMNDDGTMARVPDLVEYCRRHELKLVTIAELVAHRRRTERLVERVAEARLPTTYGAFTAIGYRSILDDGHHVAIVKGDVAGRDDVLVGVHAKCVTGDLFRSLSCDCGVQLEGAMRMVEREGLGVVLYLSHGRGVEHGHAVDGSGAPADLRELGIAGQILGDLGLTSIRVLTNASRKVTGLEGYGLSVSAEIPIEAAEHATLEHR
jgi:3,4-dihydroxy 2-butanone 4-phosphate synthase/GTP cyclohydrolase II